MTSLLRKLCHPIQSWSTRDPRVTQEARSPVKGHVGHAQLGSNQRGISALSSLETVAGQPVRGV